MGGEKSTSREVENQDWDWEAAKKTKRRYNTRLAVAVGERNFSLWENWDSTQNIFLRELGSLDTSSHQSLGEGCSSGALIPLPSLPSMGAAKLSSIFLKEGKTDQDWQLKVSHFSLMF